MNKYNKILSMFTDKSDTCFFINDFTYLDSFAIATERQSLCFFDKEKTEFVSMKAPESFEKFLYKESNVLIKYSVLGLKKQLENTENEEYFNINSSEQCIVCEGSGEVEWNYLKFKNFAECPSCDGEGEVRGKLIRKKGNCKIKNKVFKCYLIERILKTAEILGHDDFSLVFEGDFYQFRVGDVNIIIMPIIERHTFEL